MIARQAASSRRARSARGRSTSGSFVEHRPVADVRAPRGAGPSGSVESQYRASSLIEKNGLRKAPASETRVERVFDGGQDVDQVEDFLLGEEPRAADDVEIEPLGHQGLLVFGGVRERPEQERHVPLVGPPERPVDFCRGPSSLRRAGALRCRASRRASSLRRALASGFWPGGAVVLGRSPEEFDGGRAVAGTGIPPGSERGAGLGEGVGEEGVDEVEDRRDAPEVLGERPAARRPGTARDSPGTARAGPPGIGRSTA